MRLMRSPCCLCVFVLPPKVARQRLGKHVPAATNTHATVKELLDPVFSMRSALNQICIERKVCDSFFPE
jgi:hypothetical protein